MLVSVIKNLNQVSEDLALPVVLGQIRDGRYKSQVEDLRSLKMQGKIDEYKLRKKLLPAFTPSATFNDRRILANLNQYSSCIILDIDDLTPEQLAKAKSTAIDIPFTYSCFISPGKNGLKILVKVDSKPQHHKQAFNQVKEYYKTLLNVPIDVSGSDITRLCFYSFDEDLFLNSYSEIFKTSLNMLEQDIENVLQQIETNHIDITSDYKDWLHIGFALSDALGEGGRDYFHRVSKFYSAYNAQKCDDQYDKCLRSNNSGITIRTFFGFAKDYGIRISNNPAYYPDKLNSKDRSEATSNNDQQSSNEIPVKLPKRKTNKFHLVRDYLSENFDIRYNTVSTQFEYREKDQDEYTVLNENNIFVKMSLDGLMFTLNNLMAILKSDLIPHYNPFIQYFESLPPWDGYTDHISELAAYVKLKPEVRNRFDNHFKKWLVRAVKCAIVDRFFNKQAFILVHDKQNSGKSTFCRFLCPPRLSNYIAENLSIDKDSRILLTTNLLINLDELSTLSKVEISSLKSLFSKDKINDRLPYDRKNSIIPRRASFIGSTNQVEFLNDESGSVRWLCFAIEGIDWAYSKEINIDNVWAQAYHLFKANFPCELTPEDIKENEEYNHQFQLTTSERELIDKYLEPGTTDNNDKFMTATDILIYLNEATENHVHMNVNNIGKGLKSLGFTREKVGTDRKYGYYIRYKNS